MEIVVALSLLATSGLVLFAWIQQNLKPRGASKKRKLERSFS